MNLDSQCAICWNYMFNDTTTMVISGIIYIKVPLPSENVISNIQSAGNQRHKSSLVGTSETTRAPTLTTSFFAWLAGVIDGDGSILVSKQGYSSLEITMGLEDLPLLKHIQNKLGGSIKIRSGAKAYRYRLHNKQGMIIMINNINGHIRHYARLRQLHRVCQLLEIPVVDSILLTINSSWFAGFFDADGTIYISIKNLRPQLTIRVVNKLLQDVVYYRTFFGGILYFDSSQNGYYCWSVQSRKEILIFRDYFKQVKFRSKKST